MYCGSCMLCVVVYCVWCALNVCCIVLFLQAKKSENEKEKYFYLTEKGTPGINPVSDIFLPDWKMTPSGKETGR